mmetsp:Transcript_3031/g.4772  ORF Transcript_3031/g.4772 Transcript_3031/m.4772 type:complete len:129 (-) Transcript_3031:56-442(-)
MSSERNEISTDDKATPKTFPSMSTSMQQLPPSKRMETFEQKLWRKCSEEPLIPIGCGVTAYFLVSGIRSFHQGNAIRSQKMMRARVASQGFTIAAFVGYALYNTYVLQPENQSKKDDRDARILDPERR